MGTGYAFTDQRAEMDREGRWARAEWRPLTEMDDTLALAVAASMTGVDRYARHELTRLDGWIRVEFLGAEFLPAGGYRDPETGHLLVQAEDGSWTDHGMGSSAMAGLTYAPRLTVPPPDKTSWEHWAGARELVVVDGCIHLGD